MVSFGDGSPIADTAMWPCSIAFEVISVRMGGMLQRFEPNAVVVVAAENAAARPDSAGMPLDIIPAAFELMAS